MTGDQARQHAAQRGACGRAPARGRHRSIPTAAAEPGRLTRSCIPAARPTRRRPPTLPRPRTTRASRTTTTTPRARTRLLRPRTTCRALGAAGLALVPGLDGPGASMPFTAAGLTSRATSPTATTTAWCRATQTATPPSRTSRPAASRRSADAASSPNLAAAGRPRPIRAADAVGRDAGAARPAAALRRQGAVQADLRARTELDDAHGYDFVDPAEDAAPTAAPPTTRGTRRRRPASASSRSTRSREGGVVESVLQRQHRRSPVPVARARAAGRQRSDQLVVLFGHHPIRSLDSQRARRGGRAVHRRQPHPRRRPRARPQPGLRHRPARRRRRSTSASPASGRPAARRDAVGAVDRYPHVIAYVAGHTHENRVHPFTRATAAVCGGASRPRPTADWPVQTACSR